MKASRCALTGRDRARRFSHEVTRAFARSPRTVDERYVAVPGARLYCRSIGAGPPLLVLHGGPDFNHHYLLPELDRLSGAFRLHYYDQRGRGKSAAGVVPTDVSIETEVEDLDNMRRYLGREAISLLGHSWGCLLAMEYATRHPDRVDRLILLNTAPGSHVDAARFRKHRQATDAATLHTMQSIAATTDYAAGDLATDAAYYRAHFDATLPPADCESVVARLRAHFTPADIVKARAIEARLYAQTWDLHAYDLLPKLRRVAAPTLVLHGDRDFIPTECAANIAQALPHATMIVLQRCGHFAYLERPAAVVRAIVDHASAGPGRL